MPHVVVVFLGGGEVAVGPHLLAVVDDGGGHDGGHAFVGLLPVAPSTAGSVGLLEAHRLQTFVFELGDGRHTDATCTDHGHSLLWIVDH